jgi:hypothetical protein
MSMMTLMMIRRWLGILNKDSVWCIITQGCRGRD